MKAVIGKIAAFIVFQWHIKTSIRAVEGIA